VSFTFDPQRSLVIVRAELFGPGGSGVLRVALDTGATSTVVNVGFLAAIGYDTALISDRIQLTTGIGIEYAPLLALGQERLSFPVFGHTLPPSVSVDGLLGLDFLRGLDLSIDFRAGRIRLG
jgi:hypothetical protein